MRKKGIVNETTVLVIILLLTTVLLGRIMFVYVLSSGEETERLSCQISAVISSFGNTGVQGVLNPFELYCPRQVIAVSNNKMSKQLQHIVPELKGKTRPYVFTSMLDLRREETPKAYSEIEWGTENQIDQVESLIAYEMAECWKTFNEGEVQVIRGSLLWDHHTCFICSEVIFTGTEGESFDLDMPGHLENTASHIQRQYSLEDYLYTARDPPDSTGCDIKFRNAYAGTVDDENPPEIPLSVEEGNGALVMLYKHELDGINEDCLSVQYVDSRDFPKMCRILIN